MIKSNPTAERAFRARFPDARRLDGLARDEVDEYARAHNLLEGGVPVLAKWCKENFSRKDIEKLIGELDKVLNDRVEETIAADRRTPAKRSSDPAVRAITDKVFADFHGEKEYLERFPDARRLAR